MDNFEYSIQINDRDWEEFYSTAEECGLTNVSLAMEEELWLSDTEREDTTNHMRSNKPKFIRVSLCPPPPEEHPTLKISQTVVSQTVKTSTSWLDPNEDVLSGSEDEEEFGSVNRFLCQKEYMLQKKESEQRTDLPLLKPGYHDITNPLHESSTINSGESYVEYMRPLDLDGNMQHKIDPLQGKTMMERSSCTLVELGYPDAGPMVFVQPNGNPKPRTNLNYSNPPYCANKTESRFLVNDRLQDENIPDVNRGIETTMWQSRHMAILPRCLSKDDCFKAECGILDDPANLEEPSSTIHNGLPFYIMENGIPDNSCEVGAEASINSSAVEQNVPTSTVEEFHSYISQSASPNIEVKTTSSTHNPVDHTTLKLSLVPVNATTTAWRNWTHLSQPSSAYYRKTVLTLPEMYDFFFNDVSDTIFLETELNMASKEGLVYTPDMYEYFFLEDEEENKAKSKGDNTNQASSTDLTLASSSSVAATWPEACEFFYADGPQDQDKQGIFLSIPSSKIQNAADVIQSFVPKGVKGFSVRRARYRRRPDGSFSPQERHTTATVSNMSTSGSIAPSLSPRRRDVCLVVLAFASWAVKSSDLQSSDGWKTALLANIGAVSAIQYLRRRSRGTWEGSPPQPGEET
ncbi:hypothetical protein PRIEUP_LOCUS14977 [Pristimantis euphronides]